MPLYFCQICKTKAAQSRIRNNLNEKLNKKKRRPTETKGNTTNVTEYTSSITTEDSSYSDEDSNNACATRSSGYGTMSNGQRISADATITTARDSEGSSLASSTSNDASCKAAVTSDACKNVRFNNNAENESTSADVFKSPQCKRIKPNSSCGSDKVIESATVKSSDNVEELVLVTSPNNDEVKPTAAVTSKQDLETYDKSDDTCQKEHGSTPENLSKLSLDVITAKDEQLKRVGIILYFSLAQGALPNKLTTISRRSERRSNSLKGINAVFFIAAK